MAVLSREQIRSYAYAAGFRGNALAIAVAVAFAESSGNTSATNQNTNGSIDRGLWQINSIHTWVTPECAFNPACAAGAAFRISSSGTNWQPWVTYNTGAYRQYYQASDALGGATPPPATNPGTAPVGSGVRGVEAARVAILPTGKLISVWGDPRATGPHEGEDIQAAMGDPIYAPEAGSIRYENNGLGGHSIYLTGASSGLIWYFAHMREAPARRSGDVAAGTMIGRVGMSGNAAGTVPHVHYQVGPNGVWGDPRVVLSQWTPGYMPTPGSGGSGSGWSFVGIGADYGRRVSERVNDTLRELPGFVGAVIALDQAETFAGFDPRLENINITNLGGVFGGLGATLADNSVAFFTRTFFVLLGLLLVSGLIWNFTKSQMGELAPLLRFI